MPKEKKSQHYWAIHKRVATREWQNLPNRIRDIIASDSEHKSNDFKGYENYVNSETERLFNDVDYAPNDPYSFRVPYYLAERA